MDAAGVLHVMFKCCCGCPLFCQGAVNPIRATMAVPVKPRATAGRLSWAMCASVCLASPESTANTVSVIIIATQENYMGIQFSFIVIRDFEIFPQLGRKSGSEYNSYLVDRPVCFLRNV